MATADRILTCTAFCGRSREAAKAQRGSLRETQASHPATDASIVPPLWDFGINPDLDWTALFGVSGTIDGQNAHVPTPEPFPAQTNESFPSDIDEMLKRLSQ